MGSESYPHLDTCPDPGKLDETWQMMANYQNLIQAGPRTSCYVGKVSLLHYK